MLERPMPDAADGPHHGAFAPPAFAPLVGRIADFLHTLGITVRPAEVAEDTLLPGIRVFHGGLLVDPARLAFPGDLLHEAGHLAVVAPARRRTLHGNVGSDPAEEMMALAWSYAAAVHLGIDPAVVFHEGGYRGGGGYLLDAFGEGFGVGLPMLQYHGMTYDRQRAAREGVPAFPHMRRWLRED